MINKDGAFLNNEATDEHEIFEQLVKKHLNAVCATAYHILGDFHLAQDIAQEVFIKAYLNLDKLHSLEKAGGWLYSTTKTTCVDWLRKFGGVKTLGDNDIIENCNSDATGDIAQSIAAKDEIERALSSLSEDERLVITLYCISGYKAREIASFAGIPLKTAETRIRRAKQKLRDGMLDIVEQSMKTVISEEDMQKLLVSIFEKARNYEETGKQRQALEEIQEAARLAPEDIGVRLMLANKLSSTGYAEDNINLLKEAEKEFQNIISKGDMWLRDYAYNGLGQTYFRMKEFDKAIECYKKMLIGKGINGAIGLGQALRQKGDYDEAIRTFQSIAHNALSELLLSLSELCTITGLTGDLDKAVIYSNTKISVLENLKEEPRVRIINWNVYMQGAKLQIITGNNVKALEYLHKARECAKLDSEYIRSSILFDKLKLSYSRTREGSSIEWLLKDLEDGSFNRLRQEQDFIDLVERIKQDIRECKSLGKRTRK